MGHSQHRSAEASALWLAALIEAMNEVGASQSQACESSVLTAFRNRLTSPAMPVSQVSNSRHEGSNDIPVNASLVSTSPFGRMNVIRILKPLVFAFAVAYFVVDAIFVQFVRPLGDWIAKRRMFAGIRAWIVSLRPYPTLALFAVPIIIFEPIKPMAAYSIATGQMAMGTVTFIVGEILKLTFVDRLFKITRPKLLRIPAFAWLYGYWRSIMNSIKASRAWRTASRELAKIKHLLRNFFLRLNIWQKNSRIFAHSHLAHLRHRA